MTAHNMNQNSTRPHRINDKASAKDQHHADAIPTSPTNASTTSGGSSNSSSGASRKRGRELAGKHDAKDYGEKALRTSNTISPASSVAAMAALAAHDDHDHDHEDEDAEVSEEETSDVDQLASVAVAAAAGRPTTTTGAPRERRLKSLSQLVVLKNFYAIHPRVTKDQVRKLIAQTGLTHREVTRWFRNERHKEKKLKEQGANLNYSGGVVNAAQAALLIENERKARNNQQAAQQAAQQASQQTSPQQQPQMHPSAAAVHQLPPQAQMMTVQPTYYRMQPANGAYPPPGYTVTYQAPYMPVMSALAPPMHFAPATAVAVPTNSNNGSPSSSPSNRFPPATNSVQQAAQQAVAQAQLQYESAMRTTTTMLMSGAATPQQLMPYYNPSYGTTSYLAPSYLPPLHSTNGQTSSSLAPATQFKQMTAFPYMQTIGDASASANGNGNANTLVSAETQAALAVTSMSAKPISV